MRIIDIDGMTDAYIECALWSSVHFENEKDACGMPFDQVDAELAQSTREEMRESCADFIDLLEREEIEIPEDEWSDEQIGHDFWLTRNGHGAGFWDRGFNLGDLLTKWAKTYGSSDLYVGDDGMIYCQ